MADQRTIKFTFVVDGDGVVRMARGAGDAFTAMGTAAQAGAGQAQEALSQLERATRAAQGAGAAYISGLREQVALYGKSEGEVLRYRAAQAGVAMQAHTLIERLEAQKAAHQQAAMAAMQEQVAQREAAAAKRAAEQASEAFVASLREQVATLGMTRTELLAYRAAQLGVAAEAAPMIARLSQAEQMTGKYGMTAGQLSQAMRMLPMQMTDVVTSLASGMPVWMVAIQQGGQLRDQWGGFRPLLTELLSRITPMHLALGGLAVVVGATALAFVQGQREASAYNQALILTGNYVGSTSGQLGDMARDLAGVNGTVGAHAAALAEVAGSGKIAGSVMAEVAGAAVAMEGATGKAVSASVAEFVRLGEEPAKASAKLNEQYHYLTSSVYAQIAALEKAGKADEAAELAQRTFAAAMKERAEQVRQNLGLLESAWASVSRFAKQAWDSMLNIGRESTMNQQLDSAYEAVRKAQERVDSLRRGGNLAGGTQAQDALEAAKQEVAALREKSTLLRQQADSQTRNAEANERAIAQQTAQADIVKRYATDAQRLKAALDEAAKAFGGVIPPDVEARIRASFKGLGAAAKKELDEAAKAVAAYKNLLGDLTGKDSGLNTDFNDKLEVLRQGWKAGADSAEGYRQAVQALIAQQPFAQKAAADQKKWLEDLDAQRKKSAQEAQTAVDDYLDAQLKGAGAAAEAAEAALKSAQAEYDQYGLSKAAVVELTILKLKEAQIGKDASDAAYRTRQREIAAMEELAVILRRGEARDASIQAAKDAEAAWQSFATDIERSLTDSLYRSFEAGGSFFETFWASIKNTLKSTVLKVGVQAVVNGASNVLGLGTGGNAGSAANLFSTATGLYKNGSAAYNTLAGLLGAGAAGTGLAASAGTGLTLAATTGTGFGLSAATGAGLGLSAATGTGAGLAAGTGSSIIGAGIGTSAAAGGATVGTAASGTAMSGLAAAGPYVAAALALYAIAQSTKGETRGGGQYGYGATATGNYGNGSTAFIAGPSGGQIEADRVQSAIDATVAGINATLKSLGSQASLTGFQAALETSNKGRGGVYAGGTLSTGATFGEAGIGGGRSNYDGTLYETTSSTSPDAQAALQAFSTDLLQATVQALQAATDIPKSISEMLAGVDAEALSADAATTLLANVNAMAAFSSAVDALPFDQLKNLSFAAADSLFGLMGGVEGFSAALGSYFEAYYTEAERQQQSVSNVQRVFTELGLTMPTLAQSGEAARAQFRQLVEAQDLNTEQGRQAYAALMGVSSAYAELTPLGLEAAASVDAVTGEVRALSQTMVDLGREHTSLQDQYDRLTLSQGDYRAKAISGYTAEEQAAARANFALADQIAMLQEAARLDQQRTALENQLLQVQGNTAALRERELATLPESLRALQQRIYLLTDEAAASQEAARQAQEVASARAAQAQQLTSLELQLLQAQGNTAEIRRRELEAMDPSLRAIQALIYTRQDETATAQQAASARAAQAQQLASLELQLLQAQGNTAEIRHRELAALDPSARAIQELIYARQDEVAAASAASAALQEAAQRAAAILQERNGLEAQWLQLIGDTAALRQRELATLDPSNRVLQESIWARQDQIAADQAATQAAQAQSQAAQEAARQAEAAAQAQAQAAAEAARAVQQAVEQIAAQRLGLTKRLLQLQGDTVALRALELAELDPSNQALQEQIWALEDQQAALASVSRATETVTSQADALTTAWQGVGDAIAEEIKRIRGLVGGQSEQSMAGLQAQFAVASAQARAGDQEAAKALPALSQAVLQMAEATAATAVDLRRMQGSVAASLEGTLGVLGNGAYLPRFGAGGDFGGGWRLVGEYGPELEATGASRIFDAVQTRSILAGGGESSAELQQLVAQGEDLLRALTQLVVNSGRMARNLANVTSEAGDSICMSQRDGDQLQVAP